MLDMNKTLHKHAAVVDHFGGPTKMAKRLGFPGKHTGSGSSQSVCNWKWRGIPKFILLKYRRIITPKLLKELGCDD